MKPRLSSIKSRKFFLTIVVLATSIYAGTYYLNENLQGLYNKQISTVVQDRNGEEILIEPNSKGHYMRPGSVPKEFGNLLIAREDRYFYYHPGINPGSIARSLFEYIFTRRFSGSSTITQQLAKNLLGKENERTFANKIIEALYAAGLELHTSKREILEMYANTAYFGKQAEGIREASRKYFNSEPEALNETQYLELLATLNYPADTPGTPRNNTRVTELAKRLQKTIHSEKAGKGNEHVYERKNINVFELSSFYKCETSCNLTVDNKLTGTLREVLQRHLGSPAFESVNNGAAVVIRVGKTKPANELLAIIGSPNPYASQNGYQINMAARPRPIGSTWKPFIYAKAFEKGARPYTIVEDIEYKYDVGTGFSFYPKNYDGKYRGEVTMHYALANSLNVPAVRTLQYVGLDDFAKFLVEVLSFRPHQPLEEYQLSIALGGLEMDVLTLVNYFSVFPANGVLKPLIIAENQYPELPMSSQEFIEKQVIKPEQAQLVTKILSDRVSGVDQFGLKSNLNLPSANYAVKTGTTYDYHDSWTIGYTPDFVVGVWLGNSDNKPMRELSGSVGAGKIWHDVMNILLNSEYNTEREFDFSSLVEYKNGSHVDYGLEGDDYDLVRGLFKNNDLVIQPHNGDTLRFEKNIVIPLVAKEKVEWIINDVLVGSGRHLAWSPPRAGLYLITARGANQKTEKLRIDIKEEDIY